MTYSSVYMADIARYCPYHCWITTVICAAEHSILLAASHFPSTHLRLPSSASIVRAHGHLPFMPTASLLAHEHLVIRLKTFAHYQSLVYHLLPKRDSIGLMDWNVRRFLGVPSVLIHPFPFVSSCTRLLLFPYRASSAPPFQHTENRLDSIH